MKFIKQAIAFMGISGIGWIIDFSLYSILTIILGLPILYSNIISAIPATILVFIVSTQKIFTQSKGKIKLRYKYVIYFAYQIALLVLISMLGQFVYTGICNLIEVIPIISQLAKIGTKLVITPITMTANFIVMKLLSEKC